MAVVGVVDGAGEFAAELAAGPAVGGTGVAGAGGAVVGSGTVSVARIV